MAGRVVERRQSVGKAFPLPAPAPGGKSGRGADQASKHKRACATD